MKRIATSLAVMLGVLMIIGASPTVLRAEEAVDVEKFPIIAGVELNQAGASLLAVNVKGESLPRPKVLSKNPSEVRVLFPGTRLPSLTWSRNYDFTLLEGIDMEQNGEGVLVTFRVTEAVRLKKLEGQAPARVFRFHFEARDAHDVSRERPEARSLPVVSVRDPLAKSTPITLELRDVDIRDVFRMLGEITKMNIIADPSMPSAYVTVSLKKVPLNEAFGYLMRMYDLGYAIMGKTIIVGKKGNLGKTLGQEKTRSFHIAYADPAKAASLLQGLAGVEKVVVDERQRFLYVTATEEMLQDVQVALQKVDAPGKQVLIEARIVEVSEIGQKSLENLIEAVYDNWWLGAGANGTVFGYTYADDPSKYDPVTDKEKRPQQITGVDLTDIAEGSLRMLDFGLEAIVQDNKGKVIAKPSVIALDGKTAVIKLIDKYLYESGLDEAGNPTIEEEEVGPTLEFTPTMGRDGYLTLKLSIETGEVINKEEAEGGEKPQTSRRSVETELTVRNGEPFVVGGLIKESNSERTTKTPVLGDIPLLGELFRSKSRSSENTEVVMVVVPYILDTPSGEIEHQTF